MHPLPFPTITVSLTAGLARLKRGDFNHVLTPCRRCQITQALYSVPAVYEAVVGVRAPDLIPCSVDELGALTRNSRKNGVPPRGAGFRSQSEFSRWYTALNEFFHLLAATDATAVAKPMSPGWERPLNSTISRAVCVAA